MKLLKVGIRWLSLFALLVASTIVKGQILDGTVGVAVTVKAINLNWKSNSSANGTLQLSISDLNGTVSVAAAYDDPASSAATVRFLPGQVYYLNLYGSFINSATIQAVPPVGYVMEIDQVQRESSRCTSISSSNTQIKLRVLAPDQMQPTRAGTAGPLASGLVYWQASLGTLSNGSSAGYVGFIDAGVSSFSGGLFTPQGLTCLTTSSEVVVIKDSNGAPRQILAPQACVDIVVTSADQCELKFYHRSQMSGSGPLYSFSGYPFAWYFINQANVTANSVQINCDLRNPDDANGAVVKTKVTTLTRSGTAPNFTWVATDWHEANSTALSQTQRARSGWAADGSSAGAESVTQGVPSGTTATSICRSYQMEPWGPVMVSETLGSSSPTQTVYSFYDDISKAQSGNYGRLRSRQSDGQSWEAYEYYDSANSTADQAGALYRLHQPYNTSSSNVPTDPSLDTSVVTTFTYQPDPFGRKTRPGTVSTTVNGTTTSSSSTSYTESGSILPGHSEIQVVTATRSDYAASGSAALTTVTKYFSEDVGTNSSNSTNDFYRGQVYSNQAPTGAKQSFVYQRGTWNGTTFTPSSNSGVDAASNAYASRIASILGSASSVDGGTLYSSYGGFTVDSLYLITGKSTMQVQIRDNYALLARTENYVWSSDSWQLIGWVNYTFNKAGQLTSKTTSAGTSYTAIYDGETMTSETGEDGVSVAYKYDTQDRLHTATTSGVAASGSRPAIGSTVMTYEYDASSHLLGSTLSALSGTSETIASSQTYDDAGRLKTESKPGPNGPLVTTYSYSPTTLTRTITAPDGTTTSIETQYIDGSLKSVTGTGVIPKYYTYAVNTDGTRYSRANLSTAASVRKQEAQTDWLGRTTSSSRPGYNGTSTFIESSTLDPNTGLLSTKSIQSKDSANTITNLYSNTLYQYTSMGILKRSGMNVSGGGALTLASADRIADSDQYYEQIGGSWWLTQKSTVYPTTSSEAPLTASIRKLRITGLGSTYSGVSSISGVIIGEEIDTDANNISVDRLTVLDASNMTASAVSTMTGVTNPSVDVSVAGLPVSHTDSSGVAYITTYDTLLRPTSVSSPDNTGSTSATKSAQKNYYANSLFVKQEIDGNSNAASTYYYDANGRVSSVVDAVNHVTRYEYTAQGQIFHKWGDGITPVEYQYDEYGQCKVMLTYRDPSSSVSWASSTIWPASSATPSSKTEWTYDAYTGLLTKKTDASNQHVDFDYYPSGQVYHRYLARLVFNSTDHVTSTYTYDPNTRELTNIDYNDGTHGVVYSYTRSGQINTVTDSTGTRTFHYDPNQPTRLQNIDLGAFYSSRRLTPNYDAAWRLAGFQLGTASTAAADLSQVYSYDSASGLFTTLTSGVSNQSSTQTYTYSYQNGLVTGFTVAGSSFSVSRGYEPKRNLITSVTSKWGVNRIAGFTYTYNSLAQRESAKQSGTQASDAFSDFGNSTYNRYIYDGKGQLTNATGYLGDDQTSTNVSTQLPGRQFAYTYDQAGNRLSATRNGSAGDLDVYTPNDLNQYDNRTNPYGHAAGTVGSSSVSVTVSPSNGVLATVGRQGTFWEAELATVSSSTPTATALTVKATSPGAGSYGADLVRTDSTHSTILFPLTQTFTYDYDGNLSTDGLWSYSYDAENRLAQMTILTSSGLPIKRLYFQYDYLGRRVQKDTQIDGGTRTTRRYCYDGNNLVAEFDAPSAASCGDMIRSYAWGLDIVGSLDATGGVGALLSITNWNAGNAGNSYFCASDGNGNVAALVNSSNGYVAACYEYSPFGELLRSQASDASVADQPFRFSSKQYDAESGLVYYGNRYYSPQLGRFVNRDPIAEAGGLNLYGSCRNDLVNAIDVLGFMVGFSGRPLYSFAFGSQLDPYALFASMRDQGPLRYRVPKGENFNDYIGRSQGFDPNLGKQKLSDYNLAYAEMQNVLAFLSQMDGVAMISIPFIYSKSAGITWGSVDSLGVHWRSPDNTWVDRNGNIVARGTGPNKAAEEQNQDTITLNRIYRYPTKADKDNAIALAIKLYGISMKGVKSIQFDGTLSQYTSGETDKNGNVKLGWRAFGSVGWLAATIGHEVEVHVQMQLLAGRWWTDAQGVAIQEVQAWAYMVSNASRFGLSADEISRAQGERDYNYDLLNTVNKGYVDAGNYSKYDPTPLGGKP